MPLRFEKPEFFMVWTKRGHVPRKMHLTEIDANKEAVRLSVANPGKKFIVLSAATKFWLDAEQEKAA